MKLALLLLFCVLGVSLADKFLPIQEFEKYELTSDVHEEDHYLSFGTICRNKQYPFEQHKVRTYDGYFLTIFRIPGKKGEALETAVAAKRPVVLLWHGLLDSADSWILNDEDKSPAFYLANQGYDVWLGNSRGNKYSREHRFLDPDRELDEDSFFGFSFEDMANHDTNATVQYIRLETGKANIGVIGHSLGATQFLIAPQTGISVMVNLAATASLNNTQDNLVRLLAENDFYLNTLKEYKINEFMPFHYTTAGLFGKTCQSLPGMCEYLTDEIMKIESDYVNQDRIDEWLAHSPAGTSRKNIEHFVQLYKSRRFQRFDYGLELNRKIYNRDTPPEFDFSKTSNFKIIHLVGEEDIISVPLDGHWLREQLGSRVIFYGSYRMSHYSFLLGKDTEYLEKIVELFKANAWA